MELIVSPSNTSLIGMHCSERFCGNIIACYFFLSRLGVTMAGVIRKFFIASMFMWVAPVAILYGFNHNLLPGKITFC